MKTKKGVSPVVATVLLIAMVIVIGMIIFLWFRGFVEEEITKFGDENIKLACGKVKFDASYSEGNLYISNTGTVPIFDLRLKISEEGEYATKDLRDFALEWQKTGLNSGGTFSEDISYETMGADSIILIPVLLGSSESGERTFACDEEYGTEIIL